MAAGCRAAPSVSIDHALLRHPDGPIVASFPRAGRINAAQILAELGDDRSRFPSADALAAEAGAAPVTRQSGKHRAVSFRWACNKRLRQALTCFADNSRHSSPWAADVYRRTRDRGCDHPHATRILARGWCRVLCPAGSSTPPTSQPPTVPPSTCFMPPDHPGVDTGCLTPDGAPYRAYLAGDCLLARYRSLSAFARRPPRDSDPTRKPNPPNQPLEPSSVSGPSCPSTLAQPITRPRCTLPTKSNFLHGQFPTRFPTR